MTWIPRLLLSGVLVVAIGTAAFTGCASTDRSTVPPALIGRWLGGSHGNGQWYYEFAHDGGYRAWPAGSPDTVNVGSVVVDDDSITFSNGGAPITATWSLSNGLLLIDGDGYVRA
jgi:hypothetical protein